jgi:hypothetical protein
VGPSSNDFDIAPDGREIAMTADLAETRDAAQDRHRRDRPSHPAQARADAVDGRSDSAPRYSPDGHVVAYLSHDTERSP